jgi:trk system potassium uptake protein TrkA
VRVVIVGCGRVGANLANSLDQEGHTVSIVDHRSESFQRFLSTEFRGSVVLGNGLDEDVLRSAGIEQAEVFAAVTDKDNTNIMASQIAQYVFGVKKVVCRIYDPNRNDAYRTLGLETVAPILISANRIRDMLKAGEREHGLRDQQSGTPQTRG